MHFLTHPLYHPTNFYRNLAKTTHQTQTYVVRLVVFNHIFSITKMARMSLPKMKTDPILKIRVSDGVVYCFLGLG